MFNNTYEEICKAQNGNKQSLEELVKNNMGLVFNIVNRFLGRGIDREDLVQIGTIGLIKSIQKFDINFNVQFSTYAVPFILGEIKRAIRDDGSIKVSRSIKELAVKIKLLQNEYNVKKGQSITVEELSKELKVSKDEIIVALDATSPGLVFSMNENVGGESDGKSITVEETLQDSKNEEQLIANKLTITKLVKELGKREKNIVELRYFEGKTQSEVAKIIGISQVQVSRIEKKILQEMKKKIVG